jgi:hypothetical protein
VAFLDLLLLHDSILLASDAFLWGGLYKAGAVAWLWPLNRAGYVAWLYIDDAVVWLWPL